MRKADRINVESFLLASFSRVTFYLLLMLNSGSKGFGETLIFATSVRCGQTPKVEVNVV